MADTQHFVAGLWPNWAGFAGLLTAGNSIIGEVASPRLFLIDTFGFIFRAYHARARSGAPPMRTSTGLATEAVYIFNNMLRKLAKQHQPAYIAAIYESLEPTHRSQEFAAY